MIIKKCGTKKVLIIDTSNHEDILEICKIINNNIKTDNNFINDFNLHEDETELSIEKMISVVFKNIVNTLYIYDPINTCDSMGFCIFKNNNEIYMFILKQSSLVDVLYTNLVNINFDFGLLVPYYPESLHMLKIGKMYFTFP